VSANKCRKALDLRRCVAVLLGRCIECSAEYIAETVDRRRRQALAAFADEARPAGLAHQLGDRKVAQDFVEIGEALDIPGGEALGPHQITLARLGEGYALRPPSRTEKELLLDLALEPDAIGFCRAFCIAACRVLLDDPDVLADTDRAADVIDPAPFSEGEHRRMDFRRSQSCSVMSQSRLRFIAAILYRRISRLTTGDATLAKRSRQERAPNEDVAKS
jgi:hypothetical protein